MKITIAPSKDQSKESIRFYSVTIEYEDDDSITHKNLVEMFFQAAIGAGFNRETIHKEMNEFKQ